jgi:RNA polymerase sigma-70 factor, ECF subfamily
LSRELRPPPRLVAERPKSTREGDLRAETFARHARFVRRVAFHLAGPQMEVDDLTQEILLRVHSRRGEFRGEAELQSWIYGIALRVVANARRRALLRRWFGLEAAPEPVEHRTPAMDLERHETSARVYAALDRLPEKKRVVLVLFELEGLGGQEIAQIVGCPLATVWTRLHHARQAFARELDLEDEQEARRMNRASGGLDE